jgi:hypothetical protein
MESSWTCVSSRSSRACGDISAPESRSRTTATKEPFANHATVDLAASRLPLGRQELESSQADSVPRLHVTVIGSYSGYN